MWLHGLWNHEQLLLQWGAVIGASLVAAGTDLRDRRIPNALTGPLFLTGLIFAAWVGGWRGLADGALASVILAAPYIVLFLVAGGGAGDAKCMGAIGAWLGVGQGAIVLASVAACGVVFAVACALWRRQARLVLGNLTHMSCGFMAVVFGGASLRALPQSMPDNEGMQKIPYGMSIFIGVAIAAMVSWTIA